MKLSNEPTNYLLLRAHTNSEWDNCNFAIIHMTDAWKKEQRTRLKAVQPFSEDTYFQSLNYYDTAVDFYVSDEEKNPDLDKWLADKSMVFIELDQQEAETLSVPENRLDCYRLEILRTGSAFYKANGKHTSEEFWTDEFSLEQLI